MTVGLLARSGAPAAEVTSCIAAGLGMQLEECVDVLFDLKASGMSETGG